MDKERGRQRVRKEQGNKTEGELKDISNGPINYTHIPSTVSHFVAFAWAEFPLKRLFSQEDIVGGEGEKY